MNTLTYLANLNKHPRDDRILFDEPTHVYTIDGDSGFTSVTTWNHSHFEHFDSDSAYDASTSTFTVPSGKGGKYQVNGGVSVDDINDSTYCVISLYVDGSQATGFQRAFVWSPSNDKIVTARMSNVISLNAGQTVNIYVLHSSTGTQSSENYCNYFSMFKLPGV